METSFSKILKVLFISSVLLVFVVFIIWTFTQSQNSKDINVKLVMQNGKVVGAGTLGAKFYQENYFWGRLSATDFQTKADAGSNKGPSNAEYLKEVQIRIDTFMAYHPYLNRSQVPLELVTASSIGNDPFIAPESAYAQVKRVAKARNMDEEALRTIVEDQIEFPFLGFFGQAKINVLKLNEILDTRK